MRSRDAIERCDPHLFVPDPKMELCNQVPRVRGRKKLNFLNYNTDILDIHILCPKLNAATQCEPVMGIECMYLTFILTLFQLITFAILSLL